MEVQERVADSGSSPSIEEYLPEFKKRVTPKERRDILFKRGRPNVRPLEPTDMGVLWAAYKAGSFALPPDMSQDDFVAAIEGYFSSFGAVWVIDDDNHNFSKKRGQVG